MPGRGKRESRAFGDYLSIGDRYSAQTNFDSKNTIGGRLGVNRAHKRCAAFLRTVIKRQQWQIGDSLLKSKFGQPVRPARKPLTGASGFPSATPYGDAPKHSAESAVSPNCPA